MRVAVYAIAKNEATNVARFMRSCRDADVVVVTDTGSDDGTPGLLRKLGAQVHEVRIEPWRFDEARNVALDNVPENIDVCISIDLDETLQPGWREALEAAWTEDAIRGSYWYVAEWMDKEQTIPKVTGWRTKVHRRHGFRWHRPVHEEVRSNGIIGQHVHLPGVVVHHHRLMPTDYVALLDQIIAENPEEVTAYLQRGGDHLKLENYAQAVADYEAYLRLEQDNTPLACHRRALARIAMAQALHKDKREAGTVLQQLLAAAAEDPNCREAWVYLADAWSGLGNWSAAYGAAMTALSITERGPGACEEICWGDYPRTIASSAFVRIMNRGGN